ncbi:MAG: hypothetical protein KIT84_12455 [Labilithrix sp.]|nr:hypothetical protein [Labilithrix sp.]MCW5811825.1 hypothetical protein [Labilithrix sp.]
MTDGVPGADIQPEQTGTPRATAVTGMLLVLLSYLFRLPALLNARSTNSDAAVVGLQAMHVLRGEHSPFLWGSGYQTSADSYVAAAFFAVLGPTPLALMVSSLTLHVVATLVVFGAVLRRAAPWVAFALTLPLVFAPASVHTYALYPPRQLSITLALATFWAFDYASDRTGARASTAVILGGLLYGLAVSADPYPLVLAPIVIGFALLTFHGRVVGGVVALALGLAIGLVPFFALRRLKGASDGPLGLSLDVVGHNLKVLWSDCLPWALSYRVYTAHDPSRYVPWRAPVPVQALQLTGAFVVVALVVAGLGAVRDKNLPWPVRRLGFIGALGWPVTIAAFLVSVMVMDHFSTRYLATLTLLLPFAALPAARMLRFVRFTGVLGLHLATAAICGWLGYGPFVRGVVPVVELPEIRDDYALFDAMKTRGVKYATADYWASYRLTLLSGEDLIVVPANPREDRYPPHRRAFEEAPLFAYVYDRGRSREDVLEVERQLVADNASVEKAELGVLTVFVVTRK